MPSLILTGYPSTGKSTFAKLLSDRALSHKSNLIKSTVIINEQTARPDKTIRECYTNSTEEKLTRSALKSEFDKYVKDSSKLVILDSMNYIKGFRYELHCISKAAGQKHGVIWLMCNDNLGKVWNKMRTVEDRPDYFYTNEQMEELIQRYEPPDQRNRWDRPLYRVDIHSTLDEETLKQLELSKDFQEDPVLLEHSDAKTAADILKKSVYNMHSLSKVITDNTQSKVLTSSLMAGKTFRRATETSGFQRAVKKDTFGSHLDDKSVSNDISDAPMSKEEVIQDSSYGPKSSSNENRKNIVDMTVLIDGILDSFLLDVEALKEGMSTKVQSSASSNVLHDVDSISQETMNAFLRIQESFAAMGAASGNMHIPIGKGGQTCKVKIGKNVKAVEIKRLRRQYLKWVSSHVPSDTSEEGIAKSFLSYVENQI